MQSKLTKLAQQRSAAQLQLLSRQSYQWLRDKVATIRNPASVAREIERENHRTGGRFVIGGLYFFHYNPKLKATLPYYDVFPMTLILERYPDGFLGLNLHYLPVKYRLAFLDKLMDFAIQDNPDEIRRMRVSYDILSASKRYKEFRPCLKKYLYQHVQSRILAIQPNEWEVACHLPLQQFKKENAATVWEESMDQIRKN